VSLAHPGLTARGRGLILVALTALLALSRVYQGVRHDSRLYFGDALARLDPAGVGRDLIFTHDGQFGFSLYTPVLAALVKALGVGGAGVLVTAVGLVLWLAALIVLAHRLLADRPEAWRWAAVAIVVAAPPFYGAFEVFGYGEPFATPRILVEAAGMAALSLYLSSRRWAAIAVLLAAMVLHPIMALCGLGVIYVALCLEDRRWIVLGAVGGVALATAALLGLPLANRLTVVMDPVWRALCEARSPTIFPGLWPPEAWGRLAVQGATLATAIALSQGAVRRVLIAALGVGLAGVLVGWLLGDRLSLLLVLQVQPWRTQALLAILAALSLVVALAAGPRRGLGGTLCAAALAIGWIFLGWGVLPFVCAMAAAAALWMTLRVERPASARAARWIWTLVGLALAAFLAVRGLALVASLKALPAGAGLAASLVWNSGLPGLLAIAGALGLSLRHGARPSWPVGLAAVGLFAALALSVWDARAANVRLREGGLDPELTRLMAARPGEVLWLAGDIEPWSLTGRASWASRLQGAGMVFSRPLAVQLGARVDALVEGGWVGEGWRTPFAAPLAAPAPVTLARRDRLCARSDAPAWIVAPLRAGDTPDPALHAVFWRPTAPYFLELPGQGPAWLVADRYAVIRCKP